MRHLDLELERLEQRIAPGIIGGYPNSCDSHSSKSKSKSKTHNTRSKSKSKSNSKSKSY
jgi:hypothetical protein